MSRTLKDRCPKNEGYLLLLVVLLFDFAIDETKEIGEICNMNLKHPTRAEYISDLLETRRNSRRAINRCKRSATRFEWHLAQIEESESELIRLGVIKKHERWGQAR